MPSRPVFDPCRMLMRTARTVPLLTAEQERTLALRIADGDREARDHMAKANLRLVVSMAKIFRNRGLDMDDLIGEGNVGLMTAVDRFDPTHGVRFSTYASMWIKQAIRRALNSTAATIRLPDHLSQRLRKWKWVEQTYVAAHGCDPTPHQISVAMQMTAGQEASAIQALHTQAIDKYSDDVAESEYAAPHASLDERDYHEHLCHQVDRLDKRERAVITMRFALSGGAPATLVATGEHLGVSREYVRLIEDRAIRKLKAWEDQPHAIAAG
jgi:RNA polymerase primary sigma factor